MDNHGDAPVIAAKGYEYAPNEFRRNGYCDAYMLKGNKNGVMLEVCEHPETEYEQHAEVFLDYKQAKLIQSRLEHMIKIMEESVHE